MIKENVQNLLTQIPATNPFGEKVTLVAAVKTQTPESINEAIQAGITDIGDNHVQEFKDKYSQIIGEPKRHFIGHLQTNKVKYLIGKVDLYHSVDRLPLAEEISKRSENANVISPILLQVNIGNEETKGGFELQEIEEAYNKILALPALNVEGLMAMLPNIDDKNELRRLASLMREKFDYFKGFDKNFKYLSMGMSGDWKICVENGSNMIRLGTAIFGNRIYK
jgi:hypothetical protein